MLRSFTTTTSSQVIREKVRGVQNFKILVGTTGRRPRAVNRAAGRRHPTCLNSRRPAAKDRIGQMPSLCMAAVAGRCTVTRGDGRSRHFGTAVAIQAVQCRASSAVPRLAAWHKITALTAAQLLVQVG